MRMPKERKLLWLWLLSSALALLAVGMFNAEVDVSGVIMGQRNLLTKLYLRRYVSQMETAPNGVAFIPRERQIKLELLKRYPAECYAIGSSHINGVSPKTLPRYLSDCRSFRNLWVGGGAIDDLMVFAREIGEQPGVRKIVIGIFPFFFETDNSKAWLNLGEYISKLREFFENGARGEPPPEPADASSQVLKNPLLVLQSLVNGDYLLANWRYFVTFGENLSEHLDGALVFHADGNMDYSKLGLDIPSSAYQCNIAAFVKEASDPGKDIFVNVVSWLRRRNIELIVLLTPVHPSLLNCENIANRAEAERYIHAIGAQLGLPVVGGYDSRPFGIAPMEIRIDGEHPLPSAFAKLRELEARP